MLLHLRSLNERALGTRMKSQLFSMEIRKRARREEGCYRNLERGVGLKGEKILQKITEKMDHG